MSEWFKDYVSFWGLTEDDLHTSNDFHDLVVDHLHSVINIDHPIVDAGHSVIDTSYPIVNGYHCIRNSLHPLVNSMCDLQIFCSRHLSFFLCQPVNFFSASSISVLLINFFKYFSVHCSVNIVIFVEQIPTHSPLLNLSCRDPKNRENLDHYLDDYVHHL